MNLSHTSNMIKQAEAEHWIEQIDLATRNMSSSERYNYRIPTPDRELLLEAVKIRQDWLIYLQDQPDEEVLLAAVTEDGYAISNITRQSDAVKLAAIKSERGAIEYIHKPSIEVQVLALTHNMEPGYFDSENLAFYGNQFTDEALAIVNPALILMRQMYDENQSDVTDLVEVYDSVQPFNQNIPAQTLPNTLAP